MLLVDNLDSVLKVSFSVINIIIELFYPNRYNYTASKLLVYSPFGDGDGPIVYSRVYCNGNEKSLFDCRLSLSLNFYCASYYRLYTLSLRCTDGEN